MDGLPPGIVSAVPDRPASSADLAADLAYLRRWATDHQPTVDLPPLPIPRVMPPQPPPTSALWFRMQFIYAPVVVTDPRVLIKNITVV